MLTWIPNGDYTQPGALKDITNAWPTNRGYRPARAFDTYDNGTSKAGSLINVTGFACFSAPNSPLSFVSHPAKIYSYYTMVDRSRTVGGAYTAGKTFFFAATFDACYATNGTDTMQKYSFATSTTFENIATTVPKFKILLALGTQLLGFNTTADETYNGQTYFASGSRWWCSQAGAPDNFEPKVAANCATDKLDDQDGEITAAIELNGYAVVFKRSAIYIGEFVGPPVVMAWKKVHSEFGCVGPWALTKCDNRIYFVSPTNGGEICMFDGSSVTPLSYQLLGSIGIFKRATTSVPDVGGVFTATNIGYCNASAAATGDLVYFCAGSSVSGGYPTTYVYAYNVRTGRFGYGTYTVGSSSNVPTFIWSGAEGNDVGAIVCNVAVETRTAVLSATSIKVAAYTQYRESYNGKKYSCSAGQAYFLGAIPGASVAVTSELPAGSGTATMASDGRYTFKPQAGARITQVLTMAGDDGAAADHEITRLELNVGEAGDNKSAPKGILT